MLKIRCSTLQSLRLFITTASVCPISFYNSCDLIRLIWKQKHENLKKNIRKLFRAKNFSRWFYVMLPMSHVSFVIIHGGSTDVKQKRASHNVAVDILMLHFRLIQNNQPWMAGIVFTVIFTLYNFSVCFFNESQSIIIYTYVSEKRLTIYTLYNLLEIWNSLHFKEISLSSPKKLP